MQITSFLFILYCHLWLVWLYHIVLHYFIKVQFKKKSTEYKMCVLIFFTTLVWNLILRRFHWDIIINLHLSSCNVSVILVRFSTDLNSLDTVSQNTQISNFIKIHPVGAELIHIDGRMDGHTDMTKLTVIYCNFVKAPKNCPCLYFKHPTILCKMQLKCPCKFLTQH